MHIPIKTPQELGLAIRATRRAQKVRLDDVSGSAGVGHVFTREVEHGKETVQLGRVLRLLEELGIELMVDVPDEAMVELARLRKTGLRPLKPRASRTPAKAGTK
jgi:transcriptional regulator with XRE-family HTH domain